jgi:glycosyltransferase involved in cell wall biosynthesis
MILKADSLVSILVSAFNEEKYIEDCIQSCLEQTWPNIEVVFFNDGSRDATLEIVNGRYRGNDRVKILSSSDNVGKIIGFNKCFAACSGEFIHLLGADDVMNRDCITKCVCELIENQYDALYHGVMIVDQRLVSKGISILDRKFASVAPGKAISEKMSIPSGSWSINRSIATKIFPIPLEIPYEDVWASAVIKCYSRRIGFIKEDLTLYRQHDKNTFGATNTSFDKVRFRCKRDLQYFKFVLSNRLFNLKEHEYAELSRQNNQCEVIVACNSYKDILFADLPLSVKVVILRNSNRLIFTLKERLKSWL